MIELSALGAGRDTPRGDAYACCSDRRGGDHLLLYVFVLPQERRAMPFPADIEYIVQTE
jgi:hypothetical protein